MSSGGHALAKHDSRGPRVMHVITPSRLAGAETFLARLLRRAASTPAVHRCVVSRSPADASLRASGMEFEVLGIGGKANLLALPRLRKAAQALRADVVHSHLSTASWWSGWLERFGGPPSIGHVHGFTSAIWHRHQTHLLAVSQAVKDHLIQQQIPSERITVLHNALGDDEFQPTRHAAAVRNELGVAHDTPVVGTFAHLSAKKGYRELVQAAEIVLRRVPRAQFWCCGDGPLCDELRHAATAAGIADRFRLLGFRHDVPDMMRAIDVMCLPSHREPFGLVYVEAALAEKPVIACRAGGAPEVVEHRETGLLVPPRDVPALANALLEILENRTGADTMGRRGRQWALDRFAWSDYLARLGDVYDRVLRRGKRQATTKRAA